MKPNEFEEKVHELEEALNERRDAVARTKTSDAENQKMLTIQKRVETFLEDVDKLNGEGEKRELIQHANELLLELRQPLT